MCRVILVCVVASLLGCATAKPSVSPKDVLRARIYIEAEYDAVWERFTEADSYAAWYSTPCREFAAQVGEPIVWGSQDRVVYQGELLRKEKGLGLTHSFQFVDFGFDEPPTHVDIEILEQGPTVLVSIRHDCTRAPRTSEIISPVGWQKSLSRLKTLLETGRAMPWPASGPASAGP